MDLKKTPLYDVHARLGARLVEFAGWSMPVEYSSIIKEHNAVRSGCGIFDCSHMGVMGISGKDALDGLEYLTTNEVSRLEDGQCQYSFMCNPSGGIIDDIIVYRVSQTRIFLCVNAVNTDKAYNRLRENIKGAADVRNLSAQYALLALQGPESERVLSSISTVNPSVIRRFHFVDSKVCGVETIVSRTGYTGEDGFELYIAPSVVESVWHGIMEAGRPFDIMPCGLGSRDTLRLEMGYPLYGSELSEDITPLEAGLERFISFDKDFMGKGSMIKKGVRAKTLIGFFMDGKNIARGGYNILKDNEMIGLVTSGSFSPSLKRPIGMGYVGARFKDAGAISIEIRGKLCGARITGLPFYRKKPLAAAVLK